MRVQVIENGTVPESNQEPTQEEPESLVDELAALADAWEADGGWKYAAGVRGVLVRYYKQELSAYDDERIMLAASRTYADMKGMVDNG